jgi:type IV pilus assembly protein PilY1
VADLSDTGVPTINAGTSGDKIWEYFTDDKFSVTSEISALDTDGNGYVDRLYFGDTGGNIWRCDVGDKGWSGKKVFSLNSSSNSWDKGRKIFYKPAATLDGVDQARIYVGTGDREHPLNPVVTDRIYALWERNETGTMLETSLMDVTNNTLQLGSTPEALRANILQSLEDGHGWYIRMETAGEKVLAPVRLYNEAAYFTTYAPFTNIEGAECGAGNVGIASAYAVSYLTGEAVVNYYAANDYSSTDDAGYIALFEANSRATPNGLTPDGGTAGTGVVLGKEDRKINLPTGGIPSGLVIVNDTAFIGAGGALPKVEVKKGQSVFQLYWKIN